jgi:DNA-binding HxlR family transcriptional regulator
LAELSSANRRYHDVLADIEGVSPKVLTDTLRRSERDGLITRSLDADQVRTATVYQLTELAFSLGEPLEGLSRWVSENWRHVEAAQHRWDQRLGGS